MPLERTIRVRFIRGPLAGVEKDIPDVYSWRVPVPPVGGTHLGWTAVTYNICKVPFPCGEDRYYGLLEGYKLCQCFDELWRVYSESGGERQR